jgi:hypothetical protein
MLNMNYLEGLEGSNTSKKDMSVCNNTIKNNATMQFLTRQGYRFYNHSIFDFDRQPAVTKPTFLPRKTILITSQTLLSRLHRDLWFHLVTGLDLKFAKQGVIYRDLNNNDKIYELTLETARQSSNTPKFVYAHFMMPHYPYYFDRDGNPTPEIKLTEGYRTNKAAYIDYLRYSNKKLLSLIDEIRSTAKKPPVIILMGDHGFREFDEKVDEKYYFMNLNAVLLPDGDYSKFYEGMSNVNQFRVILNSQFQQQLPLLKDSTSYLRE